MFLLGNFLHKEFLCHDNPDEKIRPPFDDEIMIFLKSEGLANENT